MMMKHNRKVFLTSSVFSLLCIYLLCFNIKNTNSKQHKAINDEITTFKPFSAITKILLDNLVDSHKTITISFVDYGYIDLAVNYYRTSISRHNISNHLMISPDHKSCNVLRRHGANCGVVLEDLGVIVEGEPSTYGTLDFKTKTHIKSQIVLQVLELGYTVVLSDVDVVFLQNPLPVLRELSEGYDLVIQQEKKTWNVADANLGFYLVKPTNASRMLFKDLVQDEIMNPVKSEQILLNKVLSKLCNKDLVYGLLKCRLLPPEQFPSGTVYWEDNNIMFLEESPLNSVSPQNEVIVHNNWIYTKSAKIYRFKETLMWHNDENEYYTSNSAKYIIYENPFNQKLSNMAHLELESLKNAFAIGYILNRIVILPKFHCRYAFVCNFMSQYSVERLDKYFSNRYREHVFLKSPFVPNVVKRNINKPILIATAKANDLLSGGLMNTPETAIRYASTNAAEGASVEILVKWFGTNQDRVLRFHTLYGAFQGFPDTMEYEQIRNKIKSAFKRANYRQNPNYLNISIIAGSIFMVFIFSICCCIFVKCIR